VISFLAWTGTLFSIPLLQLDRRAFLRARGSCRWNRPMFLTMTAMKEN
jgi:hypothetical protein